MGLAEFKYLEWLEYRKSPDYPDADSNHFGLVQLEPIVAYIKGRKFPVYLSGSGWDQIVRTVTWRDIDREGLDGEPGTRTMASGHVSCFHWVKKHVVHSKLREYWLAFIACRNLSLYYQMEAERLAARNVIDDAELAVERAERQEAARVEAQRLADAAANHPLTLLSQGKLTRRTARMFD